MLLSQFPVVAWSPFGTDPRVAIAASRAGALGVVDLRTATSSARSVLDQVHSRVKNAFAVRVSETTPADLLLPESAAVIVVDAPVAFAGLDAWRQDRQLVVIVTSVEEADAAVALGADALIASGSEAGGRVGDTSTFILLQKVVPRVEIPVYARGGIGLYTAAAAHAAGAVGVVLDEQLCLCRELRRAGVDAGALRRLDGSESAVADGQRTTALGIPGGHKTSHPLGEAASNAALYADRYKTVGGVVQAIIQAMRSGVETAARLQPLAPGGPLALDHGTRYPIVQGPMTRVSDRADFALEVSRGGGLPFLALALLRARNVENLLTETASKLGELPWGVGILGFVPPELREAQLEVIKRIRPPFALIAGGRPSQARPLEAVGIRTYLHVPSPGLLELFLKDGARRFIFEGRECGGHVGPRSSFGLWEQQIDTLLAYEGDLAEVSVLFAGGIHDGQSAAMVAAMAAPLAARGACIGVLMGTAYLFTEEAVSAGAILESYQQDALACSKTALLETAPGHATRCVENDYVRDFRAERDQMEAEGRSKHEIWARLEQLNLGRLRVASKGVRREGDVLVEVDEATRRAQGMVMIGDVATMRGEVTTVESLHEQVSAGSVAALHECIAEAADAAEVDARPANVAIVGMACVFPGAEDLTTFWSNIIAGKDVVREVDPDRWNPEIYYAEDGTPGVTTPSKWGGFLDKLPFDPLEFGIPPRSLAAVEPVQLLALEVAKRALADAGYADREFDRARASVIFGAEAGTDLAGGYGFRALWPQLVGSLPPELDAVLPVLTEDSFPGVLANVIAGRIANRLDLGGANYTVDAACASSLASVDLGVKELTLGTSDLVLAGGADLHNSINDYLMFSSVHALSKSGRCRTFDGSADGIALGEGVAAVVLKRLEDAERDGDRIYGVIQSVAASSDGRHLGLTAPRKDGQKRALDRAYRRAGISPERVGLVEAHGTGTVVGDRTELATLTETFASAGAAVGGCTLGSVKSQIGHTKCAAGLAGLIKMALSVHHGVRPPTLHVTAPNPYYKADESPFLFRDKPAPWPAAERVAGVSAFGFGGTNFHAVLTSYDSLDTPATSYQDWPAELFVVRGEDDAAVARQLGRLRAVVEANRSASDLAISWRLRDVARTFAETGAGPVRVAIVAESFEQLAERVTAAEAGKAGDGVYLGDGSDAMGGVAFLCPGQGSQRPGMLGDLFVAFPELQAHLRTGERWWSRMYPGQAFDRAGTKAQRKAITDTRVAQPTLGMADLAAADLLARFGVTPDRLAGHSYGELAALAISGALSPDELPALSEARGVAILDAAGNDPGAMAAVAAGATEVSAVIDAVDGVVLANLNAPDQTVISGTTQGIDAAVEALSAAGLSARPINVACAFHSPVVEGAAALFASRLKPATVRSPSAEVWSNTTAAPYPTEPDEIRERLAQHIISPVRFAEQIEAMWQSGTRIFVECGPGRVLSNLTRKVLGKRPYLTVPIDRTGEHGVSSLLHALGQLAVVGVPVQFGPLFDDRETRLVDLDAPVPPSRRATVWWVDGQMARPARGELPAVAMNPVSAPVVTSGIGAVGASAEVDGEREHVVMEYLQTMRKLVDTQREVMLSYLGTPVPAAPRLDDLPAARVVTTPEEPVAVDSPAAAPTRVSPRAMLLDLVSERTGYPLEMLGLDLDLEADLSIDSIKRLEILGALGESLGLGEGGDEAERDAMVEELARLKTLRGIVEWLEAQMPAVDELPAASEPTVDVQAVLMNLVSERTGYPLEMLGLDLDLEADLSIDSIKRLEILGALGEEVGFGDVDEDARDAMVEELARLKTLRAIVEWLEASKASASGDGDSPSASSATTPEAVEQPALEAIALQRFVVEVEPAPELGPSDVDLAGAEVLIAPDDRGVAEALAEKLTTAGARPRFWGDDANAAEILVDLESLRSNGDRHPVKSAFEHARALAESGPQRVLAASGLGGDFGRSQDGKQVPRAGISGLIKTWKKERPAMEARLVDLDVDGESPEALAEQVLAELLRRQGPIEVGWRHGQRHQVSVGKGHAAVDEVLPVELGAESVVLLTGGARGITARVALALASATGCAVELVGRSPEPSPTDPPDLAEATDAPSLRRAFLARGETDLREVERQVRRTQSARQIRATLTQLRDLGCEVVYHSLDVRDEDAFGGLIDDIYARRGRLDGVIHGAGVLEDRLMTDKTPESFERVFDTKVTAAKVLSERLKPDTGFVVFFSSVSGAFGNRGQVDYAAANDALDKMAFALRRRILGRVLSVNWGPWAGTGMVSPELEREYQRRGIGLIEPEEGVRALLDELSSGRAATQIVLMCAEPAAMA